MNHEEDHDNDDQRLYQNEFDQIKARHEGGNKSLQERFETQKRLQAEVLAQRLAQRKAQKDDSRAQSPDIHEVGASKLVQESEVETQLLPVVKNAPKLFENATIDSLNNDNKEDHDDQRLYQNEFDQIKARHEGGNKSLQERFETQKRLQAEVLAQRLAQRKAQKDDSRAQSPDIHEVTAQEIDDALSLEGQYYIAGMNAWKDQGNAVHNELESVHMICSPDEALFVLEDAVKSLRSISKSDFIVMSSLKNPSSQIVQVIKICCLLFDLHPVKKSELNDPGNDIDDYWTVGRNLLLNPKFVEQLLAYEKDNIPAHIIEEAAPLLKDPSYSPEIISRTSKAAGALCKWTKAIYQYYLSTGNVKQRKDESTADKSSKEDNYLKEALAEGKKEWGRSKIMIVGEGRAGKTALANSILGKSYENTDSTVGINEFTCNVGYASITTNYESQSWSEYKDHKNLREYETALAKLIYDKKNGKINSSERETKELEFEELLRDVKKERGYLIGEEEIKLLQPEELQNMLNHPRQRPLSAGYRREDTSSNGDKVLSHVTSDDQCIISNPTVSSQSKNDSRNVKTLKEVEIDTSLVMKYLGEKACVDSKFIISVFDFGGQSIFNAIHPFFLTRIGVYVIVFNMEWLSSQALPHIKEECIKYMTFWLNSVIIHTQNEKQEVAPIFFVGTRKDLVSNPADHQFISTTLFECFSSSLAWPYVIENYGAEGSNGKADLCFYPVDNKLSNNDETVRKLLMKIEETIDRSSYVHLERPLSWFQVLDLLKSQHVPFLTYKEASDLIVTCDIPAEKVSLVLRFFHEMGILMWHDEDTLRDVVVLDPIQYFVKPATVIICKHVPDQMDGIFHVLEIHKTVRKTHSKEFQAMIEHGIVTEVLLSQLLKPHEANFLYIRQMMLKYGLLVPIALQASEGEEDWVHDALSQQEKETLYLAPALLPEQKHMSTSFLVEGSQSTQFYFLFTPSKELGKMTTIAPEDCRRLGFLPHGLFEKLMSKALMWSMKTSDFVSRATLYGCYRNTAELAFGNQTFRMHVDARHHLISVIVDGNNPIGVHDRLRDQLQEIIAECLKSLKFITVLRYQSTPSSTFSDKDVLFLRLNQVRALVEKKGVLSVTATGGRSLLSAHQALILYSPWLVDYTCFDEYDLFLSYRWGLQDSDFTLALFDRMSLYSVEGSRRAIRAFLDRRRLEIGQNFQQSFLKALTKSLILVPIVSHDALVRMITMRSEDEDNVLIEWICGMECVKQQSNQIRLTKIMPIFFGSLSEDGVVNNLFQGGIIDRLPDIIPAASLKKAKNLLESYHIKISEHIQKLTVKEIVQEVCKFLFLCAWEVQDKKHITVHAAEKIIPEVNKALVATPIIANLPSNSVVSPTGNDSTEQEELSLPRMKEMIKNELGLTATNMQDIIQQAMINFSKSEQEKINNCISAKDKALMILKFLELL